MDLSIIVPLYNEEQNVAPCCEAVRESLSATALSYEIVLVDDGSKDGTFAAAAAIAEADPHVRVVKFRRNFGQTAAISAGIREAQGRVIVTMDGDLQNDPDDIPMLLEKLEEGYDIVVGWRHRRQDEHMRVLISKIANRIITFVSGVPVKDLGCSLKAYRAELIKNIPLYSEMHRFIPVMTSMTGARLAEVKVRHHPRQFGQSKYGYSRIIKVMLDIVSIRFLVSFVRHPGLWSVGASLSSLALGMLFLGLGALELALEEAFYSVVLSTIGTLFVALGIVLFAWGLIGYLMVANTRNHPLTRLSVVSWNLVNRTASRHGAQHVR